ncbi:unnamed protein product [Paramecium octaurelia]|uniref:Uncharacterized protein n=1 Tax=Paramecium octaurelia TaxID=43137 RepID=A0A8S1W8E3_PAROT|nr:unnamed protein product [Paramecium octaurelia]
MSKIIQKKLICSNCSKFNNSDPINKIFIKNQKNILKFQLNCTNILIVYTLSQIIDYLLFQQQQQINIVKKYITSKIKRNKNFAVNYVIKFTENILKVYFKLIGFEVRWLQVEKIIKKYSLIYKNLIKLQILKAGLRFQQFLRILDLKHGYINWLIQRIRIGFGYFITIIE